MLQIVYFCGVYLLSNSGSYLKPADEFCNDEKYMVGEFKLCTRGDLAAFQAAAFIPILFCGVVGFWSWQVSKSAHLKLPQTVEGRLFGRLPEAAWLGAFNFSFQLWDFFISLSIPEHATPIMLTHHVMAGEKCTQYDCCSCSFLIIN